MKYHSFYCYVFLFVSISCGISAQEIVRFNTGCNYTTAGKEAEYALFEPSIEASEVVEDIAGALSIFLMPYNLKASNVTNALAVKQGETQYILYSEVFLRNLKNNDDSRWAVYSVMAHEIGHHVYGHDLGATDPQKRRLYEIQADNLSGGVLCKLGASFEQALIAVNLLAQDTATATHPSKSARFESVANGWNRMCELIRCDSFHIGIKETLRELDILIEKGKEVADNPQDIDLYEKWRRQCVSFISRNDLEIFTGFAQEFEQNVQPVEDNKWYQIPAAVDKGLEILKNLRKEMLLKK